MVRNIRMDCAGKSYDALLSIPLINRPGPTHDDGERLLNIPTIPSML